MHAKTKCWRTCFKHAGVGTLSSVYYPKSLNLPDNPVITSFEAFFVLTHKKVFSITSRHLNGYSRHSVFKLSVKPIGKLPLACVSILNLIIFLWILHPWVQRPPNFSPPTLRAEPPVANVIRIWKVTGMHLQYGLCAQNFGKISQNLEAIGCDGPVSVSSNQTVCVKFLQVHNKAIVGVQGGYFSFVEKADLKEKRNSIIEKNQMCLKVSPAHVFLSDWIYNIIQKRVCWFSLSGWFRSEHTQFKHQFLVYQHM